MMIKSVIVRGPRNDATVLLLVGRAHGTCEVTDRNGLVLLREGDDSRVVTVHRSDVFKFKSDVQTGDIPDWDSLTPI